MLRSDMIAWMLFVVLAGAVPIVLAIARVYMTTTTISATAVVQNGSVFLVGVGVCASGLAQLIVEGRQLSSSDIGATGAVVILLILNAALYADVLADFLRPDPVYIGPAVQALSVAMFASSVAASGACAYLGGM